MRLLDLEVNGFKSFAKKTNLEFNTRIVAIVGPNGSGKSNVVEAFRFVLGEQSMKSMRGRGGADLIFKGSKDLPKGTKASATIYFNNSDRVFKLSSDNGEEMNLNFDTISITREVYIDGLNKYILNGSEVRLKDIHNLLASLNIGSSGHHIISQGEADRILNANAKEKREMIEDALGLKVFQYKIKESTRKLERSNENLKEVILLKRENAPHLAYLKKQIEKFEKIKELKEELINLYNEFLSKESVYIQKQKISLNQEKEILKKEVHETSLLINQISIGENIENPKLEELKKIENDLNSLRRVKSEIERKLGRMEGMIESRKWKQDEVKNVKVFNQDEIQNIIFEVDSYINEALNQDDLNNIKNILRNIKNIFIKLNKEENNTINHDLEIKELENDYKQVLSELEFIKKDEEEKSKIILSLKEDINKEMEAGIDKERERFALKVKYQELNSKLSLCEVRLENLAREIEQFENEIREGEVLIGNDIYKFKDFNIGGEIDKSIQDDLKRRIERIKIKIEDSGLGNLDETLKEYNTVNERDVFLIKEIEDLTSSIYSLEQLILDLKNKIDIEFKNGINKINIYFKEFFSLMFGGGDAKIIISQISKKKKDIEEGDEIIEIEEEEKEEGIEIDVSLPHKKVKELHSLSGGERSLTSIALLFAMSSVNPPPFLILDETDAALDEANSRRYGDMLERLGKGSQLIVVTHNRETMSRANILYGVTVSSQGASQLLSVKFDEASALAK